MRLGPEAGKTTLIRRATLDLTGLPPTPEEVADFLADDSPAAYERLVDRLLASPRFGERWGRVWLDLARYADSAGYAQDPPREIWRYRDWVVENLNANQSFADWTRDQLAGDLLPDATPAQQIATAFHRNTMTNSEGGTDDEEFRTAAVVDRVNTTFQVWMGLTMGCAQCHTHKYDPITHAEYFQAFAIFNQTRDNDQRDESPTRPVDTPETAAKRSRILRSIARAERLLEAAGDEAERRSYAEELVRLGKQLERLTPSASVPVLAGVSEAKQRKTHIHIRGSFLSKGPEVTAGVPAAFHPLETETPDRADLADWLLDERNPLTARVTVNRLWEQLFGIGIVETSEDFGLQGELPSHPRLLDHLATELVRGDWDIKRTLRSVLVSQVYRQSSFESDRAREADPRNRLLSHFPRTRLSAEMIRDQALAASGLLSQRMLGPSVRPVQPKLGLRAAFGPVTDWEPSEGQNRHRRGLYTYWRRTTPYPSFMAFDAPSREVCTIRRIRTNTPLQALVTLNDPVFVEAAQALARRVLAEAAADRGRVDRLFELVVARRPSDEERQRMLTALNELRKSYAADPAAAEQLATDPLGPLPAGLAAAEAAAWTVLANVALNLDETLSRP